MLCAKHTFFLSLFLFLSFKNIKNWGKIVICKFGASACKTCIHNEDLENTGTSKVSGEERRLCGVFRSNRSVLVTFQRGQQTARQVTEELGHVGAQNPKQECYGFFCFLYHRHVFLQFIFINEVKFVSFFFYIPPHFHFFYNEIIILSV